MMGKPDNYLFHDYDLKSNTSLTPVRFLFNHAKNLRLQHFNNWRIYESLNPHTRSVKARIAFHIEKDIAQSPLRAPFGFIELFDKVSSNELTGLFSWIELDFKARGVNKIKLKGYPEVYEKDFNVAEIALKQLHYNVDHEVSSVIPVDRKPFEKKLRFLSDRS